MEIPTCIHMSLAMIFIRAYALANPYSADVLVRFSRKFFYSYGEFDLNRMRVSLQFLILITKSLIGTITPVCYSEFSEE